MKSRLSSIAARRLLLVTKAAQQRESLAKDFKPIQNALSVADKSANIVRFVKKHPVLIIGLAAFIAMLRPTRAVKWLRRSWIASLALRALRNWLTKQ